MTLNQKIDVREMNIPLLAIVLREMLDREEEKLYKQGPLQSCQKRKTTKQKERKTHGDERVTVSG